MLGGRQAGLTAAGLSPVGRGEREGRGRGRIIVGDLSVAVSCRGLVLVASRGQSAYLHSTSPRIDEPPSSAQVSTCNTPHAHDACTHVLNNNQQPKPHLFEPWVRLFRFPHPFPSPTLPPSPPKNSNPTAIRAGSTHPLPVRPPHHSESWRVCGRAPRRRGSASLSRRPAKVDGEVGRRREVRIVFWVCGRRPVSRL